ncbi:hypothetical protein UlMin_038405 [Ulmus minor]
MAEPCLRPYLQEVGVHRWSRAHSEGQRYNIMTTNISEYLNAVFVKKHELLVIALAEEMRSIVQRWHYECHSLADKCKTKLTVEAEKALAEQYPLSLHMRLDPASDTHYTMFDDDKNGTIDLEAQTCSCIRFQLDQLPCAHAMIVIRYLRGDVYEYCSEYYSMEN